jgi:transposase
MEVFAMNSMRRKHLPKFEAKVALEAHKEEKTSSEIAVLYQVHPGLILQGGKL